ncbi:MAG: hypothetical protein Q4A12_07860 [Eubacteriales bacterium]|nr:hypothetical protein [Eubacteriales bacterium]
MDEYDLSFSNNPMGKEEMLVNLDTVYRISEEFERDSRRYNRAFIEEQEVSTG